MTINVKFFNVDIISLEWSLGTVSELNEGCSFSFDEDAKTAQATFPSRDVFERWENIHIGEFPRLPDLAINSEDE